MKSRPTLLDVASEAGVSLSTASRAINEHPDVSEATMERVLQVAANLGYYPSAQARSLIYGTSMIVGLVISDITNLFYPGLARAIEDGANAHGYSVILCDTEDRASRTRRYVERLLSFRVDGIIHASVGLDEPALEAVTNAGIPLVFTNRRPRRIKGIDAVVPDYLNGGRQATQHLISQGRRKILHLAGPEFASSSHEITRGYGDVLREAGFGTDPDFILNGDFTIESGIMRMRQVLDGGLMPDAILAANDYIALGAMEVLFERGLDVPGDVAVVGCDNTEVASLPTIQLSSIDLDIVGMGHRAWDLLYERIQGAREASKEIVVESKLIVRSSSLS
jgi:DNA-binding LacI/PurR family transcriptional regulator